MVENKLVIEISSILAILALLKDWYNKIIKIIEPAVKEAERQALDGEIKSVDRKAIAWSLITSLEAEKKLKLNFFTKIIVSQLINIVADKLPNFTITKMINKK